jgi:hypothetical protein
MNENIRISDADRERVVERLREHFAEGRLTSDELDERVSAALSAKTYGDLRTIMTDLPEPETVGAPGAAGPGGPIGPMGWQSPWLAGGRPTVAFRRGPRILPLVLVALAFVLLVHGGWVIFAFLQALLVFWLVMCLMGIFAGARFRRHARRYYRSGSGPGGPWQHRSWRS